MKVNYTKKYPAIYTWKSIRSFTVYMNKYQVIVQVVAWQVGRPDSWPVSGEELTDMYTVHWIEWSTTTRREYLQVHRTLDRVAHQHQEGVLTGTPYTGQSGPPAPGGSTYRYTVHWTEWSTTTRREYLQVRWKGQCHENFTLFRWSKKSTWTYE